MIDDRDRLERDELMEAVYNELRLLAESYLRNERADHTLQPTALVHEAYLRIRELKQIEWRNREHFIAMAATMMRRVLVNYAVNRKREKRGGGDRKATLIEADLIAQSEPVDVLRLEEAMSKFALTYPQECRIVELKFFGGLTVSELAEVLAVSESTVERDWRFARAWLMRELKQ